MIGVQVWGIIEFWELTFLGGGGDAFMDEIESDLDSEIHLSQRTLEMCKQ